jgi:hypothetical protein
MVSAANHLAESLPILLSCGSLLVAFLSLAVSLLSKRQAKKAALLGLRREGINHIRAAKFDVSLDGNISPKTVTSIREALQLSSLVFSRRVSDMLDGAHKIAFRLQSKPFELQTDQDDRDRDVLEKQLEAILSAMNEQTALRNKT